MTLAHQSSHATDGHRGVVEFGDLLLKVFHGTQVGDGLDESHDLAIGILKEARVLQDGDLFAVTATKEAFPMAGTGLIGVLQRTTTRSIARVSQSITLEETAIFPQRF